MEPYLVNERRLVSEILFHLGALNPCGAPPTAFFQ